MVRCNFCDKNIPIATGKLYIKKDGKKFNFCSSKCEKNMIVLKRKSAKFKWTNQEKKVKKND